MEEKREISAIAHIETDFKDKFGLPRQSMLVKELTGRIVFKNPYGREEALRGIEGFSHIWLIWGFSKSDKSEALTVRPPRLGGNKRVGVFATRSPYRPNGLGLSCVKLDRIEKTKNTAVLHVSGIDIASGTPIYDIKPYIPYSDCVVGASGGFAQEHYCDSVHVVFPKELLQILPEDKRRAAVELLKQDPRPAYKDDGQHIYGLSFAGYNIKFVTERGELTVKGIEEE